MNPAQQQQQQGMQQQGAKARFQAKHAFDGAPAQSQLSFRQGDLVEASLGQNGVWWWGRCNGRDGWFPPAYVTLVQQPQPTMPAVSVGQPMQQGLGMQPGLGQQPGMQHGTMPGMQQQGMMPQQQQQTQPPKMMPGQTVLPGMTSGFQSGTEDPFAGLESVPSDPLQAAAGVAAGAPVAGGATPRGATNSGMAGATTVGMAGVTTPTASAGRPPQPPANPALANVFADRPGGGGGGGGARSPSPVAVSPRPTATTAGGGAARTVSPVPPAASTKREVPTPKAAVPKVELPAPSEANAGAGGAAGVRSPSPATTTTAKGATREASKGEGPTPPKIATTVPAPPATTTAATGGQTPRAAQGTTGTVQRPAVRPSASKARSAAAAGVPQGVGIGKSGVRLPDSASPAALSATTGAGGAATVGSARFFNLYEFLAGADKKEPTRKFYPIERVAPFWALMGLDVYVEKWREEGEGRCSGGGGGGGGGLGALGSQLGLGGSPPGGGSGFVQQTGSQGALRSRPIQNLAEIMSYTNNTSTEAYEYLMK